jgi:hypothetical protein
MALCNFSGIGYLLLPNFPNLLIADLRQQEGTGCIELNCDGRCHCLASGLPTGLPAETLGFLRSAG